MEFPFIRLSSNYYLFVFTVYDKGEGSGYSVYRLKTKNGEHVYMRTNGYLEFDQNTQSIGSFICVNSLIS